MLPVRTEKLMRISPGATPPAAVPDVVAISWGEKDAVPCNNVERAAPQGALVGSWEQWREELRRLARTGDWLAWRQAYDLSRNSAAETVRRQGMGGYAPRSNATGIKLLGAPAVRSSTAAELGPVRARGMTCPAAVLKRGPTVRVCDGGYAVRADFSTPRISGTRATSAVCPLSGSGCVVPLLFSRARPLSTTYLSQTRAFPCARPLEIRPR